MDTSIYISDRCLSEFLIWLPKNENLPGPELISPYFWFEKQPKLYKIALLIKFFDSLDINIESFKYDHHVAYVDGDKAFDSDEIRPHDEREDAQVDGIACANIKFNENPKKYEGRL